MKTLVAKVALAASVFALSTSASAVSLFGSNAKIDVGSTVYGSLPYCGAFPGQCSTDGDTVTGIFDEMSFGQFLATSIYDFTDASPFGAFTDTNVPADLGAAGVPTSGTALDGVTNVVLALPTVEQVNIDGLKPLAPPSGGKDTEGFGNSWGIAAEYTLNGTLNATGPVYTTGTINLYFVDITAGLPGARTLALTLDLTGSSITLANLDLLFDVSYALPGFLSLETGAAGSGKYVDAAAAIAAGRPVRAALDTNVNPPIPTLDQLLLVGTNAIRQTTLDGTIGFQVPVPGTLLLVGLGLVGLSSARKRRS